MNFLERVDVAVIGGGIVGLAHAWAAARRNLRVAVFERSPRAEGATVRNFGMVWPVGQPGGELSAVACKSRELWLELASAGVLEVESCGSIHVAHHADELAVLEEFAATGPFDVHLLSPTEVLQRSPFVNATGLLGGLWSPTELRVDPRTAADRIRGWLQEVHHVNMAFGTPVVAADEGVVRTAAGQQVQAERIIICSGSDLQTLHPKSFARSELQLCKLQMLRSVRQPLPTINQPHLASGLTLRHYTSFADCPSLTTLRQRIAKQSPELDRYGIHVMASIFPNGEVVLGDSHEYGSQITPFDKSEIDDLILGECRKVFALSDWTIRERWHGIYAKHPRKPVFQTRTKTGVEIFVGTGGAGMTMAFGLAEQAWNT